MAEQILAGVADGRLKAGGALPSDRELAQTMQVSRPVVREALLALELLGVVRVQPGEGVYVRERPEPAAIAEVGFDAHPRELIEARAAIEPEVAALACRRADTEVIAELAASLERGRALSDSPADLDALIECGLDFHRILARHCGNHFLAGTVEALVSVGQHPLWVLVNRAVMRERSARVREMEEHRAVLEAIRRRDEGAARDCMHRHLQLLDTTLFSAQDLTPNVTWI